MTIFFFLNLNAYDLFQLIDGRMVDVGLNFY